MFTVGRKEQKKSKQNQKNVFIYLAFIWIIMEDVMHHKHKHIFK